MFSTFFDFGGPSEVLRRSFGKKQRCFKYPISPRISNTFRFRRFFGGPSEVLQEKIFNPPISPQGVQRILGFGGSSEVLRRFFGKGREASNPSFSQGISTFLRVRRFFGGSPEVLRKRQRNFKSFIFPRNSNVLKGPEVLRGSFGSPLEGIESYQTHHLGLRRARPCRATPHLVDPAILINHFYFFILLVT